MSKKLIHLHNLTINSTKNGVNTKILDKVNMDIYKGEIVGIVGEAGSGKSAVGSAILGLTPHALGRVEVDSNVVPRKGLKLSKKSHEWLFKRGQIIFPNPETSLNNNRNVYNVISEGYKNFKVIKNERDEKLNQISNKISELKNEIEKLKGLRSQKVDSINKIYDEKIRTLINDKLGNALISEHNRYITEFDKIESQINDTKLKIKENKKLWKDEIRNQKLEKRSFREQYKILTAKDKKYIGQILKEETDEITLLSQNKVVEQEANIQLVDEIVKRSFKILLSKKSMLEESDLKDLKKLQSRYEKQRLFILDIAKKIKPQLEKYLPLIQDKKNKTILTENLKNLEDATSKTTAKNLKAFHFLINFVNESIQHSIDLLTDEIKDIKNLIVKQKNASFKLAQGEERFIHEDEIKSLAYEAVLLEEKQQYYRQVLTRFMQLAMEHSFENYKEIYDYIFDANKKLQAIHISISSYKWRKRIERAKQIIWFREAEFNRDIDELLETQLRIKAKITQLNFVNKEMDVVRDLQNKIYKIEAERNSELEKISKEAVTRQINIKKIIELEKEISKLNENYYATKAKYSKTNWGMLTKEKVEEMLKLVGMSVDALYAPMKSFSAGQKQRIAIARALINNPEFIIADEAFSTLDVSVQAQVVNLLNKLNKELGLTIIFIANDLEMVNYISDRIYVMYKGKVIEYGKADKIYNNPLHPYTKSLVNSAPSINLVGQPLKLSTYNYNKHHYNEYKDVFMQDLGSGHHVRGTREEIKSWKRELKK